MAKRNLGDYKKYRIHKSESLRSDYGDIVQEFPDAKPVIKEVDKVLQDIVCLVGCTPASVGKSEDWQRVVNNAQIDRESYCNVLKGKQFSALYGLYTVTFNELKSVLQLSAQVPRQGVATSEAPPAEAEKMNDGFREQRRRKRNPSDEETKANSKKCTTSTTSVAAHPYGKATPVATRNYLAPLRMEESQEEIGRSAELGADEPPQQQQMGKTARPPPIVLTAPINLMKLNSEMKYILKGTYEYRNTRNGTRMVTSDMSDDLAAKHYFYSQKLPYFTFYPKWENL
jgi:hypothetical protein